MIQQSSSSQSYSSSSMSGGGSASMSAGSVSMGGGGGGSMSAGGMSGGGTAGDLALEQQVAGQMMSAQGAGDARAEDGVHVISQKSSSMSYSSSSTGGSMAR